MQTEIKVQGMTCGHCAMSVTNELKTIAGVSEVQVDVPTGAVVITSTDTLDAAAVSAAVEEAGYTVVG